MNYVPSPLPQRPYWRILSWSPVFHIAVNKVQCSDTGIEHGPQTLAECQS